MTINEAFRAAVEPVVAVCVPDAYDGEAEEYCTFNYTEVPEDFGDDVPDVIRYAVQLHYICPVGRNSIATRRRLRQAILAADFTAPTVENASDADGQHYVFEFDALGGADGEV